MLDLNDEKIRAYVSSPNHPNPYKMIIKMIMTKEEVITEQLYGWGHTEIEAQEDINTYLMTKMAEDRDILAIKLLKITRVTADKKEIEK